LYKMLVKHHDLTTEKLAHTTTNPASSYVQKLKKEYEQQGFVVRFEDLRHLDFID